MRVQSINLNLIPTGVMPIVHLSQYDRDADGALLFNIFNGPAPFNLTGCTATINGTKPDGNVYTYPCTVHSNFLTSAVYDQMTTVQGTHEAEIRISDGDSVVGTLNFQMAIEKAGVSEIDVSHTDVPTLLENIQASIDEAEYWAEQAASAVTGVSSFNGRHGSVLPVAGDYDASQISYGDRTVEDALDGMGGHTILNASGQEMPQRKNLRFAGANLSDDAQNDTTNVTISGGGSGGSTITVTTTETSLYGETVTISDGTTTDTEQFSAEGVATFTGITMTGTLTITSTDGTETATDTINVPYYGSYTKAISFVTFNATINISTASTQMQGQTVKVYKNGTQIDTTTFSAGGSATYTAHETGTYKFGCVVDGYEFKSADVVVSTETTYNTTIAYFGATLSITTSSSALYNQTITISKGGATVGTTAFSAQGSATYTVHETGTYTCECEGYSGSATVSAETTYSVTINAGLDLSAWITAGSTTEYPLNPSSYADFSALEADEAAVRQLMLVHDAVDYLATASAGDSLMESVIGSDVCAKWINLSDYALDTLYANSDIADEMATADKYGYGEWGIIDSTTTPPTWGALGNVPIMTANNAPYGTVLSSGDNSSTTAGFTAFDGDSTTGWQPNDASYGAGQGYVGYSFTNPVCVKRVFYDVQPAKTGTGVFTVAIEATNDISGTWTELKLLTFNVITATDRFTDYADLDDNETFYLHYRWRRVAVPAVTRGHVYSLQFYGRELKPLVPTMTGNTTPSGSAIAQEYPENAYKAFDGDDSTVWGSTTESPTDATLEYDFDNPVRVYGGTFKGRSNQNEYYEIQAYNGSEWSNLTTRATCAAGAKVDFVSSNNSLYSKFRVKGCCVASAKNYNVATLQFYGMDYSEKEFAQGSTRKTIYDHGVAPSGAITGGTKNPDCLTLSAVGTAVVTIDKGTRTYMGGKAGLHASGTNRLKCGSGYSAFTASNMPDSNGFDISSISGSVAVGIEQTASGTFDAVEIWIE